MCICLMVMIDKNNITDMREEIIKKTKIKDIIDVIEYDNYYIVKSNEYVYLIDFEYQEVFSIDINLMHSNDKDYDLVYRENMLMYMDDFKKKNKVIFKYYDIYTYEFIDEVVVGDS